MARYPTAVLVMVLVVVLVGCGGYRTVAKPWNLARSDSEFDSGNRVRVGERARVTTRDAQVVEGAIVEIDELAIVIGDTAGVGTIATVVTSMIERLEIYDRSPGKALRTIAIIGAGSAIVYAIVDELNDPHAEPDYQAPAKGLR